ncbi:MAG: hypothetical protein ABII02_00795 [Candidatus Magasanikbacteria bacterium]
MKKNILFFSILLISFFIGVGNVFAKYGLEETAGYAGLKGYGTSLPDLIGRVIGAGLSMVSVVFFALMIYAGISYMLSRGNEEAAKKSLGMIWASIIGILIVLASYALTSFVFKAIGGEPVAAPPTGTAGGVCLVENPVGDDTCITGGGSACPGTFYQTMEECKAAGGVEQIPAATPQAPPAPDTTDKTWCLDIDDNIFCQADYDGNCPNEFSSQSACDAEKLKLYGVCTLRNEMDKENFCQTEPTSPAAFCTSKKMNGSTVCDAVGTNCYATNLCKNQETKTDCDKLSVNGDCEWVPS